MVYLLPQEGVQHVPLRGGKESAASQWCFDALLRFLHAIACTSVLRQTAAAAFPCRTSG